MKFYKITNECGLEVELCDLGASLYQIRIDAVPMLLTTDTKEEFINPGCYHGKTIGRVANRIKGSKIVVNNKEYQILNNEGDNTLHGGIDGLSTKTFTLDYLDKDFGDYKETMFSYVSPSLESGFPGEVTFKIGYQVYKKELKIVTTFYALCNECDTPIALTNHAFFSLGEPSNLDLLLKINASKFIETNKEDLLAIKYREVLPCLDFSSPKKIGQDIFNPYLQDHRSKGYDHYFLFDNNDEQISLSSNKYVLDITSDFEGVQVYSCNYLGPKGEVSDSNMLNGLAIEPSSPHIDMHILKQGQTYNRFIEYKFKRM